MSKLISSIKQAVEASGLKSGMTVSFHHHLRNGDYVLNTRTMKFHYPDCDNVKTISDTVRENYHGRRGDLVDRGYVPCGGCKP